MNTTISQKKVRELFWDAHPEFKSEYRANKRQNEYHCDIRCAFVDYVDYLAKSGEISWELAERVTL